MNRTETIQNVIDFQNSCRAYRELLLESRDSMLPEIVRNFDLIDSSKANLNRSLASIERYIVKFGNGPRLSDGVHNVVYSPYHNAFTSDTLLRVGPSLDGVIDDLNIVIGRIEASSDKDFKKKMNSGNGKPHSEYWGMIFDSFLGWAKKHLSEIITGIIITVVGGIILFVFKFN